MGMLFGGYLSQSNDVTLVGTNPARAAQLNRDGVRIMEHTGGERLCHPRAVVGGECSEPVDLVIVFVKAMNTQAALEANRALIGSQTWLLTLQNGMGHDAILGQYAAPERVLIGTTQHNSSIRGDGVIHHGGSGSTVIGSLSGSTARLEPIVSTFAACGFTCEAASNIQRMIWHKLFTNASSSALCGLLQTNLGFLVHDPHAWTVVEVLIREAVRVANGDGMDFIEDEIVNEIHDNLERASQAIPSICADLRDGRPTEVDSITGSVVRASLRNGIPAPSHQMLLNLIHAKSRQPRS